MPTSALYAKALYAAVDKSDLSGKSDLSKELLTNLRASLEKRGHLKLLPSIYREYQKVLLADERSRSRKTITPESERSRVLLELYRHLITTN